MRAWALTLGLVLVARGALAGTEITVETRRAGAAPEAKPQQSLVAVEGRKLHADAGDGRHGLVFRGEEGVLQIFDHHQKTVFTLDRATARALASRAGGAHEALRNLPEPQRRAVEQWLGAEEAPAKVELRASGKSDTVNGIACRLLDALRNGARLAEICEGPRGAAGVSAEALVPVRELAAFAAEVGHLLPRSLTGEGLDALALVERVQGVPLRVRAFPKDAPATESRIVRAVPKQFGPERFEAPAGYSPGLGIHVRD